MIEMRVLLNAPDQARHGGVSAFCGTLAKSLKCISLFSFQSIEISSKHSLLFRLIVDYLRFGLRIYKQHYDIIHLNPSFRFKSLLRDGVFLLIAKLLNRKVIVFFHGWDIKFADRLRERWLWLFQRTYFLADAFIVLAGDFKNRLMAMGYRGPIYLGKTALDSSLDEYLKINNVSDAFPSPFNILFLSRVEKEKGIFEALQAYSALKSENLDVIMTVAGDGGALVEARRFIESHNIQDIRFVGHVTGKIKALLFREAHCYFFPSYEEGMPISVLEAMAFGLPVITRPVGGLPDFFEDGKMGFMTESKSPEILAELVRRLIDDPIKCRNIRQFNKEYALEHFSASSVAAEMESIYRVTLGGSVSTEAQK